MMKHQRILLAFALAGLSCWSAAAQQEEAKDWNRQLQPVAQDLEALRDLKFKKPVPFEKQTLDDFEKYVRKEIREEIPPEQFASMMKGLRRLGMVTRDFELDDEMVKALLSQAAAYYDPDTETFYVLGAGLPAMMQNTIYAHELVHALQDQHFDLKKKMEAFTPKPGQIRNDDATLALRYLVEGEATYVQTLYQLRGQNLPPMAVNMMLAMQARMSPEALMELNKQMLPMLGASDDPQFQRLRKAMEDAEKIPPYIMIPLADAYISGAVYAASLRSGGGWKAVDAAYKDLPASVEQCADVKTRNDKPTRFGKTLLGMLEEDGWKRIDAAIHGQVYLRLMLRNLGIDWHKARTAVMGWDGDLYEAWEKDGDVLVVLATTWDSEQDAREFFASHVRGIDKSDDYSLSAKASTDEAQPKATSYTDTAHKQDGTIVLRGKEVFRVQGGSEDMREAALKHLRELEIDYQD